MPPRRTHRRAARAATALLAAALAVLVSLALTASAWADAVSPEAGPTRNAVDIDNLFKILLVIGAAVILLVWTVLFYSLVKFRARRSRPAPQIRGNRPLEWSWTIGAGALVLVIMTVTFLMLDDIKNPAPSGPAAVAQARGLLAVVDQPPPEGKALEINVSGQQYIWRYQYPNCAVSFTDMVVPKDTTVVLKIKANDVAHSWWIPKLGGKQDAIPGYTNETWFKATATGSFAGKCAELCGAGHAAMNARVTVLEP